MNRSFKFLASALAIAVLAACGGGDDPAPAATQQLYTQTSETANAVVHFARQADGTLLRRETAPTGGAGTNAVRANGTPGPNSLGSQYSVIISGDGQQLFVANGGDASISVMAVDPRSGNVTLLRNTRTAVATPNSLAFRNGVLYSTFRGATQLAAYRVQADGALTQVGAYDLAAGTGLTAASIAPTQVVVSPDGRWVVVSTGTGSNAVVTYPVNADGTLGAPVVNNTQFATPFAGGFVPGVSGAPVYLSTGIMGLSLSSYTLGASGTLTQLNQAVASGVGAPCWLSITPNGRFAYVGNGSGSISSYSIAANGAVTLLRPVAAEEPSVLAGVSSVAGDSWISPDSRFLYSTYLGADKVVTYSIGADGSLAKLGESAIGTSTRLSLQGLTGA